jgi:hypothetical protein
MARTRLIKPGFFSNDLLAECDPLARLLFAGLWTIVDCDGRTVDRRARIKAQVLPYDDCNIDALMAQLVGRGFVQVYAVDGVSYLQVTGFAKHQRPHKKETSENLPEPPATNDVVMSRGNSETSTGLSETSRGDSGSSRPLTLNPSPLTLNPSQPSVVSKAPRKARRPRDPLRWTFEDGFIGVTDDDRKRWAKAYPLLDIDGEILRAAEHVRTHVEKQRMTAWRRFLGDWMARGNGWKERDAKRAEAAPAKGAAHGFRANRSHIPPDCRPEDEYLFWDGGFPRIPNLYTDNDGNLRHGETRNIICPAKPKLELTAAPNRSSLTRVGESHD